MTYWGFADLPQERVAEYEELHPNVTIQSKISDYDAAHQGLLTALAAQQGPDIAQVAVDFMGEFRATPAAFHDLREFGAADLQESFLEWRWNPGVADTGEVVGIPTDVGGMAIAYRTDLFEEAGLPTDRDEVAALWPDWEGYLATGREYVAAMDRPFVNAGKAIYRAASNQADEKYYDADGELIFDSNPAIREAWDLSMEAVDGGLSADLATWSPEWLAGMANGGYATLPAPAWMLNTIQEQAPDTAGNWDIATLPGTVGNDGGSYLMIPAASENAQAAYDFITWMQAPEQQLKTFNDDSALPSTPELFTDEALTGYTSEFFRDAPVGEIYIRSVEGLHGYPLGPDSRIIEQQFESAVGRVEQGVQTGDEAWEQAVTDAQREAE
ncbi:ABC transporter substrate-binding protein [Promicromonospora sp. Populi]|uniref:ABC transporter substrate-binding protein n=1 Tax=Promicromonospora sp. Populi TaxID=3239420 RepID=UPI0034E23D6C